MFGCGHAPGTAVGEENLAYEGRVGKIGVGGRVVAVLHLTQARSGVISVGVVEQWSGGVKGGQVGAAQEGVVAVGDGKAVQRAAGVGFGQELVGVVVGQGGNSVGC